MIPDAADPTVYHGDVYVLLHDGGEGDGEIVGVTQAMKFRRNPRVLLNRFFSAAKVKNPDNARDDTAGGAHQDESVVKPVPAKEVAQTPRHTTSAPPNTEPSQQPTTAPAPKLTAEPGAPIEKRSPSIEKAAPNAPEVTNSIAYKAIAFVAAETGLEA